MARYIQTTALAEAMRVPPLTMSGTSIDENVNFEDWLNKQGQAMAAGHGIEWDAKRRGSKIVLNGALVADPGDWIVFINGIYTVMTDRSFRAAFVEA